MPILGHPVTGPDRDRPEAMDDALETSTERLRYHLRRPHAGKRNRLTEHAAYTVNRTVPRPFLIGNSVIWRPVPDENPHSVTRVEVVERRSAHALSRGDLVITMMLCARSPFGLGANPRLILTRGSLCKTAAHSAAHKGERGRTSRRMAGGGAEY